VIALKRYAPLLVACLMAGLVAFPFFRNLTTGEKGMPGAQIGGHFVLETAAGPLDTSELKSDLMLIYFGYTYCPDVCPTELARMAQVYNGLGDDKKRVSGLFVTVDPERDTIETVTEYAQVFDESFKGFSGDRAQIELVMRRYQVYAQKVGVDPENYTVDHSSRIYLMDRDAKLMALFSMDTEIPVIIDQVKTFL
jgi:cytochrome oxidase Cu insertion factor (SCO1/SenC/PrrC family)